MENIGDKTELLLSTTIAIGVSIITLPKRAVPLNAISNPYRNKVCTPALTTDMAIIQTIQSDDIEGRTRYKLKIMAQ
jgi:hypothetical protein